MGRIFIEFTNGEIRDEYVWDSSYRIKDGCLIISKGRYESPLYVNLQEVKTFKMEES
jgi:hypothetical protein